MPTPPPQGAATLAAPELSVIIPVYNEEESLPPLLESLDAVLARLGRPYEIVCVDDGSRDRSLQVLRELRGKHPRLVIVKLARNSGQTSAFDAGFKRARGDIFVTMDADLQNDPRNIPRLVEHLKEYDVVCGVRLRRADSFVRRASSRIANAVRNRLSDERITDVGCSLKAFRAAPMRRINLFDGMHRFFPTLLRLEGCRVVEVPVNHLPRLYGTSKYGIRNRMPRGLRDLLAVRWMKQRYLAYEIEDIE